MSNRVSQSHHSSDWLCHTIARSDLTPSVVMYIFNVSVSEF